jgi:hypothetical protein
LPKFIQVLKLHFDDPGTMIGRGNTTLAKKMDMLSKPLPDYLDINTDGWIVAQRLLFNQIDSMEAVTEPITIKVAKKDIIGFGGMWTTYAAQVKSEDQGNEIITDYVEKIMQNMCFQDLSLHATDARMYEACAVLLVEYKSAIQSCQRIPAATKAKARELQVFFLHQQNLAYITRQPH